MASVPRFNISLPALGTDKIERAVSRCHSRRLEYPTNRCRTARCRPGPEIAHHDLPRQDFGGPHGQCFAFLLQTPIIFSIYIDMYTSVLLFHFSEFLDDETFHAVLMVAYPLEVYCSNMRSISREVCVNTREDVH